MCCFNKVFIDFIIIIIIIIIIIARYLVELNDTFFRNKR